MKVVLDAGHGGKDSGACANGKQEKDIALQLALKVQNHLVAKGVQVYQTRSSDTYPELISRPRLAVSKGCDLFVSIHCNSNENTSAKGIEVLYNPINPGSSGAASACINKLVANKNIFTTNRGAKARSDLAVLNNLQISAILIEVGFISNKEDLLIMTFSQDALAKQIALSIVDAINNKGSSAAIGKATGEAATGDNTSYVTSYSTVDLSSHYKSSYSTTKTNNPLAPLYKPTVMPPAYHHDTLPTHRVQQGAYYLRIGDCQFFVPPLYIGISNPSATERIPTIRQRESAQVGHGYSAREIDISLWFNDLEQINGIEIESGLSCGNYYMDGLRTLIAQFKKLPFLPIVNELLNDVHMIYAATLVSISFNTVPDLPGCVQARLVLKEFNAMPYLGVPTTCYDSMVCWPLFRWYYQQQLVDGATYAKFKLPKVVTNHLTGKMTFKILPEDIIQGMTADVDSSQNKNEQYTYLSNEWAFMEQVEMDYDNLIVENIAITLGNIVTDVQLAQHQTPTHQYMGSLDTVITVMITTPSRELVNQMVTLHNTVQQYSRDYKNRIATGYMGIDNELINMMGVDTVTIQNMNVSTVEGQPDLISIRLDLLSYNKTQHEDNTPRGFTPHAILDENVGMLGKSKENYEKPLIWDGVLEDMAEEIELYPDLNLPVYQEVNKAITEINAYRKKKGYRLLGFDKLTPPVPEKPYYVDPDFFMCYPSPISLGIIDIKAFDQYWEAYNKGGARGILDHSLKTKKGTEQAHRVMQLLADCGRYAQDYEVPVKLALDEQTQGMPPIAEDDLYKLAVHDMFAYSKRYTLCRAFPTALFLFMDEGSRVRGVRLLNNMYSYNALVSVDIYRDRDNPVDVCELVVSNIYHSLSTKPSYYDARKKTWWGTIFIEPDDEMIEQRKNLFKFMQLEAGCRVHVRMGYGSAPSMLPTTFNGMIAEIDSGPIMRILCQSDGHELTNVIPAGEESNNGLFSKGSETSDIIGNIMTDRAGWQGSYTWTGYFKGIGDFCNESRYGIEHFGNVYAKDDIGADFRSLFHVGDEGKMSYDVMKNVYKGLPYVENSGNFQKTTLKKWSGGVSTGEMNVYMYLFGKTSWDVFKSLAMANLEYVVGAVPHNFRSTLFFGQPLWPYKYGFKYKGKANATDRSNLGNYYEKVKTYAQVHCIDSMCDIIDNGTTASSNGVATAVIPVYTEGSTTKSDIVVYADKNIYPEYQKTVYYDTTYMQDFFGPEFLYTAAGFNISEDLARNAGISYLQHALKDMYKGQIVIIGDAAIKPYDYINMQDSYREMFGMFSVGAVTHTMSVNEGFITSIKPDLITSTHRPESIGMGRILAMANIFTSNYMIAKSSILTTPSLMQSIKVYKSRSTIKEYDGLKLGLNVAGGATGLAAGALFGGFVGVGLVMAAAAGWYIVDRCVEWFEKVFIGRDNHTITIMPLMLRDRAFVSGIKGHQTLIPGYSDDTEYRGFKFGKEISQDDAEFISKQTMDDLNLINSGIEQRYVTGVNIFNLETNNYETSTSSLLSWAQGNSTNANTGDALLAFGGSTEFYGQNFDSGSANAIINEALKHIGKPYVYNTKGPNTFDCSGFVYYVGKTAGIPYSNGYQNTKDLIKSLGEKGLVFKDEKLLQPGDLIFTCNEKGIPSHVTIYKGDGKYIGADNETTGVVEGNFKHVSTNKYAKNPNFKTSTTSNSKPGMLPSGKSYVHHFKNAIVSCYSDVGATSSGKTAKANGKICASHNLAFGTKIYIPELTSINGTGIFTVEDTGGPTFDFDINIKGKSLKGEYDVYILEWGNGNMAQSFESAIGQQKAKKANALRLGDTVKASTCQKVIDLHYSDLTKYAGGYKLQNFTQPGKQRFEKWDTKGNVLK